MVQGLKKVINILVLKLVSVLKVLADKLQEVKVLVPAELHPDGSR